MTSPATSPASTLQDITSTFTKTVTWTIPNFKGYTTPGQKLTSPSFSTPLLDSSLNWYVECWPCGNGSQSGALFSLHVDDYVFCTAVITITYRGSQVHYQTAKFINSNVTDISPTISYNSYYHGTYDYNLSFKCEIVFNPEDDWFKLKLNSKSKLVTELKELWRCKRSNDVEIISGDKKKILYANKAILSARSKVLKQKLGEEEITLRKNRKSGKVMIQQELKSIVHMENTDHDVVAAMLEYIYTGSSPGLKKHADQLVIVAHKYDLSELKALCEFELIHKLTVANISPLFSLSDEYNLKKLKKACLELFPKNLNIILKQKDFDEISSSKPQLMKQILNYISTLQHS